MNDQQTILLVDDSENDLKLMSIAFAKAGLNSPVQVVHNGEMVADIPVETLTDEAPKYDRPMTDRRETLGVLASIGGAPNNPCM